MEISMMQLPPHPQKLLYAPDIPVPLVTMGAKSYLVSGTLDAGSHDCHILVGSYTAIARRVSFMIGMNHDHHALTSYPIHMIEGREEAVGCINPAAEGINRHQLRIGSDVWIGSEAILMGGVHIGSGAVIGAGAVVAKDVPPYAIAVGNPARIIKYRFDTETITRLLRIQWWNWSQEEIERYIPMFNTDMAAFLERFDPGVQEPAADETAAAIRDLRTRGYAVSYFIPDFEVAPAYAVWERVIDRFLAAYTAADRAALVLAVPDDPCVQPHLAEICRRIAACGTDAPLLLSHSCTGALPFSIPALRASDVYITTREVICSVAMDDAADAHLAIRYGGDQGRLLFPPV
mgnify:CR=1 FL=1